MNTDKKLIKICMGSSCFSRGNNKNVQLIENYIVQNNLSLKTELKGCLCEGQCKKGPNIELDGEKLQGIEPEMILDLLAFKLLEPSV